MSPGLTVLAYLASASVRAILLAGVALGIVMAFRIRGPAARHAVAASVMGSMLLMPVLLPLLPPFAIPILSADGRGFPETPGSRPLLDVEVNQRSGRVPRIGPVWRPTWQDAAAAAYGSVTLVLLIRLLFSYVFTRRLVRASRAIDWPMGSTPVYESNWISTPLTAGWLRPKILLPPAWRDWTPEKLNSVLAHERTHVRRADWGVALAAAVNRCLFWFHPLAWWIERTLASLAEEACDDAALLEVDTASYAQALLDMAAAVRTAQGRLTWEAMAMAKAAEVRKRIERILDETRQIPQGFTRTRWLGLAACALPLVYIAAVVEPVPVRAQQAPMGALLKQGQRLAPGEVGMLEQHLTTHPDDLDARTQLITYYFAQGQRQPRLDHIFWLIANHPESTAAIFTSRGLTSRSTTLNDAADFTRAANLWKQQSAAHPEDARVLGNAAEFLSLPGGEYEEAERLLTASRALEPNGQWTNRLAKLYVAAILADTGDPHFAGVNSAFAARARAQMESSNDANLVTAAGMALTGVAKRPDAGKPLPPGVLDLNEHPLLISAVEFGERLLDKHRWPGTRGPAGTLVPSPPPPPPPPPAVGVRGGVTGGVPAGGPPPPPPPPAEGVREGVVGSVAGGVPGGVLGGIVGSVPADAPPPPPPPPPARAAPTKIKIGANVQAYNLISKVEPVYPDDARVAGIDGNVVLSITVAEDGHVESAEPIEGHPLLAAAAVEAVLQWKYKPTFLNKNPVKVISTVTVPFQR